ncbi:hypothetical protein M407DRAFT_223965 [Tulasnella calospora MUT 4182]|uniref:Uncharacterized protein n=1 Tax=Tulasnella calospora MUT 4182 TaxID=1051891 RepID=A0A0C3MKJ5_9AGAM|nr:hypothetical protein M407DRAFT_223965 [Tulasnella calospora MUT 4182]
MPQVQDTSSFSTTDYQPFYGGSASNQGLELNRSGNSFERDYSTSAPEPTEAPVSFQQFTGITHQSNTTKPATTSRISHESSPIAIRRRLSNAPAPDTSTNTQPTPRQPQGQAKARPSSWYENVGQWLGLNPTAGSHDEPGLSTQGNALGQDTQMTHTVNHGRNTLGGRAQPVVTVVMANRRQLP